MTRQRRASYMPQVEHRRNLLLAECTLRQKRRELEALPGDAPLARRNTLLIAIELFDTSLDRAWERLGKLRPRTIRKRDIHIS